MAFGHDVHIRSELIWSGFPGPRFHMISHGFGAWAQILYEFISFRGPGQIFHMNTSGFRALCCNSIRTQILFGQDAQTASMIMMRHHGGIVTSSLLGIVAPHN